MDKEDLIDNFKITLLLIVFVSIGIPAALLPYLDGFWEHARASAIIFSTFVILMSIGRGDFS